MKAHVMKFAGRTGLSFFSYNFGWWVCAFGVNYNYPWLGPALLPVWVGLHLYFSPTPWGELLFFTILAALGFAIDSGLMQLGLFSVKDTLWAPMWLVAMWLLLGFTFESMLAWRQKKWVFLLIGAVSGPLTYIWCDAIKILEYARPLWAAILVHGVIWLVLTPVLFKIRDWSLILTSITSRPAEASHGGAGTDLRVPTLDLDFVEPQVAAASSHRDRETAPPPAH